MTSVTEQRDTIPRLQQFTPHMRAQLIGLRGEGATFEQARRRYIETVEALEAEGLGRRTASRVGDQDAYWSPTADVLDEAMRLGLIERQQLPSARRYVNAHRDRRYVLTPTGAELATLAQDDIGALFDRLTEAVFRVHPYYRALVLGLIDGPLVCPEVTEGEVEEARRSGLGLDYWASVVHERLGSGEHADVERTKTIVGSALKRRFGQEKPASKPLSEALNDAFSAVALASRGLDFGVTELKMLRHWGAQLRVLDQSRYVPAHPRANVIWLAGDVSSEGSPPITRRGLGVHQIAIAKALIRAYQALALESESSLSAPYVPIFQVRAAAAFECRVTRALVDLVIEQLSAGSVPGQHVEMLLHLGNTRQPASEPVYRRGGARRFEMTIHISRETQHGRS